MYQPHRLYRSGRVSDVPAAPLVNQRWDFLDGDRFTEEVALHLLATERSQDLLLNGRLDSFGHGGDPQPAGNKDHRLHNDIAARIFPKTGDKAPIDLYGVEGEASQI